MSDQPTDHLAQAEKALADADEAYDGGNNNAAAAAALLGIGHALLAGIDVLNEDVPAPMEVDDRCTHVEQPGGVPLRCYLEWAHDGSHRMRLNP